MHNSPEARPTHRGARRGLGWCAAVPELDAIAPMDAAEAFRDLPGLALLESARPGRTGRWSYLTADPVAVVDAPSGGADPFAEARSMLARLGADPSGDGDRAAGPGTPPFAGGLVGYLGYDLGRRFERLPSIARVDQHLPALRLGLHDWALAWDRRTGTAWLAARVVDGDQARLHARVAAVRERLEACARAGVERPSPSVTAPTAFTSLTSHDAWIRDVEAVRDAIARGDIYQANLTRRLEAPFDGDPWPVFRRLRTGDPALFAGFLDLGPSPASGRPRALLSASPEPFLSVDAQGLVSTDPIKGTRPRGRTREQDRALARELLASPKDQAENVMIVDVLRNDLGRVCEPGSVRVPRLLRLERTAAVQHLVTTVTGRLRPDADAFDLLAAAFPGGSITGAPEDPGDGADRAAGAGPSWTLLRDDAVARAGRADGLEHPDPHVRRGRRAAHAPRRRWDHLAQRPAGRVGRDHRQGPRAAVVDRCGRGGRVSTAGVGGPGHVWVDGELRSADGPHLSAFDRGFQLGDGIFETLRARGGRLTELAEHAARLQRSAGGLGIELPEGVEGLLARGIGDLLAAEGLDGFDGDASVRVTVSRGAWRSRGLLPPRDEHLTATIVIQAWPVVPPPHDHLSRGLALVASSVRRDPQNPIVTLKTTSRADYVYARLEARRAGADDALFLTISGHLSEATTANVFLVRRAADGVVELATPSLACAILPGTTRSWLLRWAVGVGLRPIEDWLRPDALAIADEAFMCSSVAGVLPITRFDGRPIGSGIPGPWTLRARDDRERFIVEG